MSKNVVLFVDDDDKILRAWRRNFAKEPYAMLFARNAEQAISLLNVNEISIVISDYNMPEISGLELFTHIQENFPKILRILVSGKATLEVAQEAINLCGIFKLFEKPCNPVDLGLAIRDGLSLRANDCSEASNLLLLEKKHPGITQVKRVAGGAIEI